MGTPKRCDTTAPLPMMMKICTLGLLMAIVACATDFSDDAVPEEILDEVAPAPEASLVRTGWWGRRRRTPAPAPPKPKPKPMDGGRIPIKMDGGRIRPPKPMDGGRIPIKMDVGRIRPPKPMDGGRIP